MKKHFFYFIINLIFLPSAIIYANENQTLNDYSSFYAIAQDVKGTTRLERSFGFLKTKTVPIKKMIFFTRDLHLICGYDNKQTLLGHIDIIGKGNDPGNGDSSYFSPFLPISRENIPLEEGFFYEEGNPQLLSLIKPKSVEENCFDSTDSTYTRISYEKGCLLFYTLGYQNWDEWCSCFLDEKKQKIVECTITIKVDPSLLNFEEISFVITEAKTKKDSASKSWIFQKPNVIAQGVGRNFEIKKKLRL